MEEIFNIPVPDSPGVRKPETFSTFPPGSGIPQGGLVPPRPGPRTAQAIAADARPGFSGEVYRPQPTEPGGTNSGGFTKTADYPTRPSIGLISEQQAGVPYFSPPTDTGGWRQV